MNGDRTQGTIATLQGELKLPYIYLLQGEANSIEKAHSRLLTLASGEKFYDIFTC